MKAGIPITDKNWWDKEPTTTRHEIEADTAGELYAMAFRGFFNRYKYCNGTQVRFEDQAHNAPYREWVSDASNYARNGGDMW